MHVLTSTSGRSEPLQFTGLTAAESRVESTQMIFVSWMPVGYWKRILMKVIFNVFCFAD